MPVPINENEINTENNLKLLLTVKDYEDLEYPAITRNLLEEIGITREKCQQLKEKSLKRKIQEDTINFANKKIKFDDSHHQS